MCWYFSKDDEKVPWQSAQDICQAGSLSANLLSIHSQQDNDFNQRVSEESIWIGMQIASKEEYHWVDGTPMDYENWKNNRNSFSNIIHSFASLT